ncbi:MAG TPA: hypothetical protein VNT79_04240, partial [Phycisphaerae bacterium]|nr:hypothetical protein [Phycisphaerae bacterium]
MPLMRTLAGLAVVIVAGCSQKTAQRMEDDPAYYSKEGHPRWVDLTKFPEELRASSRVTRSQSGSEPKEIEASTPTHDIGMGVIVVPTHRWEASRTAVDEIFERRQATSDWSQVGAEIKRTLGEDAMTFVVFRLPEGQYCSLHSEQIGTEWQRGHAYAVKLKSVRDDALEIVFAAQGLHSWQPAGVDRPTWHVGGTVAISSEQRGTLNL